jgi:hypothetical protein
MPPGHSLGSQHANPSPHSHPMADCSTLSYLWRVVLDLGSNALHASPHTMGLATDAAGRGFEVFGGGFVELSPLSPLAAPVGEGFLIDFLIEVRDHALDAGLGIFDALIIKEGP